MPAASCAALASLTPRLPCPPAVVTVVVAILVLLVSLYLVVNYQHPEDRNQAWIPKIVVLLGFAVAFWTILLFPLDVANQQACALDVPLSSCETTLPMTQLWYAVYIAAMAITFVAVPFSIFYYEADSDWWAGRWCGSGGLLRSLVPSHAQQVLRRCEQGKPRKLAACCMRYTAAAAPAAAGACRGACSAASCGPLARWWSWCCSSASPTVRLCCRVAAARRVLQNWQPCTERGVLSTPSHPTCLPCLQRLRGMRCTMCRARGRACCP